MNSFVIPVAVSALILTSAHVASAGSGCGTYKNSGHPAAMAYHGYGYGNSYGMPQPYQSGHRGATNYGAYGYGSEQKQVKTEPNIVEVASAAGSFNTLITAVKAAGLAETLMGRGPFTVFAPTDEAFARLPTGTLEALLADKVKLTQVLTYHVVPGRLKADAIAGVSRLSTVAGSELPVADISIAKTDVMASNGVIHVIDEVLVPQS